MSREERVKEGWRIQVGCKEGRHTDVFRTGRWTPVQSAIQSDGVATLHSTKKRQNHQNITRESNKYKQQKNPNQNKTAATTTSIVTRKSKTKQNKYDSKREQDKTKQV